MGGVSVVEAFARRVILECLQEASAEWWEHRAVTFDRVGNEVCDEIADACRNKASFIRIYGLDQADDEETLNLVLAELAAAPITEVKEARTWAAA